MRAGGSRGQLRNDLAQAGQTGIDGDALLGSISLRARVFQSFTAGQIHEMELAVDGHHALGACHGFEWDRESLFLRGGSGELVLALHQIQAEDGVRSRGFGIDGRGVRLTDCRAKVQGSQEILN